MRVCQQWWMQHVTHNNRQRFVRLPARTDELTACKLDPKIARKQINETNAGTNEQQINKHT